MKKMNRSAIWRGSFLRGLFFVFAIVASAGAEIPLGPWWGGVGATGDWYGARELLEDRGIVAGGEWKANSLWDVGGGLQRRYGFDEEVKFRLLVDAAKLTGWKPMEGLGFYCDVRWRDGDGVNKNTGASPMFGPSNLQGGKQWRLLNAFATYAVPEIFGIKNPLTISGGWQNPADVFLKQPESKFFLNNTFTTARGMTANGIPWGASYAAWGGYAQVKPVPWYYAQGGLYLAIPYGTSTRNHGLAFAGYRIDPELNGLYALVETGVTPKIGAAQLPGRYAAGFLYWGVENTSFNGANYDGRHLFYWQADQMLFRESAPAVVETAGKEIADAKQPVAAAGKKRDLCDQGLRAFSLWNFAPKYNNSLPFYLQTGLLYKGLVPGRDSDQTGVAFAFGNYSFFKQQADEAAGRAVQTYEGVLEFDYRIQINRWSYVQPSIQYLIRPNGAGLVGNATVIGFQAGVAF